MCRKWVERKVTRDGFDLEDIPTTLPAYDEKTQPDGSIESSDSGNEPTDATTVVQGRGQAVDSGWAWVVLAASFFIIGIINGCLAGTSLFYGKFLDEFQQGTVLTSALISYSHALVNIVAPLGSILANRFGYRTVIVTASVIAATGYFSTYFMQNIEMLFLTFGTFTAVGFGLAYAPGFGIIALYFRRRQTFATSAVTVGGGLGIMAIPPLQQVLITRYSWREACLFIGSLTILIGLCAFLFPSQQAPGTKKKPITFAKSANVSLFREIPFYILMLHYFLMSGLMIYGFLSIRFVVDILKIDEQVAWSIIAVGGFTDMVARLLTVGVSATPWLSGRTTRFNIAHVMTLLCVGCLFLFTWSTTVVALAAWSGALSFFLAIKWCMWPGLQMEMFGSDRFSTSFSYGSFVQGIGSLILPPLGEKVAMMTENIYAAFYLSGVFVILAAITGVVLQFIMPPEKKPPPKVKAEILCLNQTNFDCPVQNSTTPEPDSLPAFPK